jgi:hypothetical protein
MNTTLPPPHDLPPGRHAEIRGELLAAIQPRQSRRWITPLVAAVAAFAVVGLVAWFVPWGPGGGATAAVQPMTQPPPTVDGVAPSEVATIEEGCARNTGLPGKFTLRQVLTNEAGRFALLYGDKFVLLCLPDDPASEHTTGYREYGPFTAPGTQDYDLGRNSTEVVMGRVAPEVARVTVTFTGDPDKVDGVVANGTFIAAGAHPWTATVPKKNWREPRILAYDKNGTLLGEISPPSP